MFGNWQVHVACEIWGVLFCLMATTATFLSTEKKGGKKLWLAAMFFTQALVLTFDSLAWIYRGNVTTVGYYMVRISNAAVFLLNYLLMVLSTGYLSECVGKKKKECVELGITGGIALIGMLLILITQFYPLIYRFDATNHYERGKWFVLSHLIAFVGMFVELWMLIRYRRKFEKIKFLVLLAYLLMPVIALLWQIFFYGISMLQIMDTVSLMCLFAVVIIGQARQLVEQEREINDMKIQIVLSQIQPHFLYNTLNTITYLCDKDAGTAKKALNDFSRYLRGNLDSLTSRALVPFDKELAHVERYLALEKFRMEDELNVVYDINDNGYMIPPMTLQPLVENSIIHGLEKADAGGTVTIRTRRTEQEHEIVIADDGVGFDVRSYVTVGNKKYVGIENVRKRLWTLCKGSISISSEKGKGTRVVIRIPIDE